MRLELEKANSVIATKDREIMILKKEVAALKESQNPNNLQDSWTAESESAADSGNCEELHAWEEHDQLAESSTEPSKIDNIDFELMETALREEEEYRHKLEEDNKNLTENISDLRVEMEKMKDSHEEELLKLKSSYSEDVIDARKESNLKVEELIIELAESSMRCARQQDTIEQRQLKIDELLKEISDNSEKIIKLEEAVKENKTKESSKDCEQLNPAKEEDKYLSESTSFTSAFCQTDLLTKDILTQTDDLVVHQPPNDAATEEITDYSQDIAGEVHKKSESTCDNKIHYTYQFLRRSIYYYITDKDNRAYHLRSIQRLLEFSDAELNSSVKYSRQPSTAPPTKRY